MEERNTRSNLAGGRRPRYEEWMDAIKKTRGPSLNFKHTLMPHVPWQFLPDGRRYRRQPNDAVPGLSNQSYEDQGQLDVLLQRHFLQTGFADRLLQELWAHLKREGLWDDSLIVVAADHGVAFVRGRRDRRRLDTENYGEIAPIPLFIKAPGQKKGAVNDAYVETIDILPTIFDVLNLEPQGEDGWALGLQRHGAEPADPADPPAKHVQDRCAFPPAEFEAREEGGARAKLPPVRHRAPTAPAASTGSGRTRSCSAGACRWAGAEGSVEISEASDYATWTRAPTSCPRTRWAG